jgi:hypothetical protein
VLIRADPGCDRKRRAHVPWMPPADAIEAIGTLADARARPVGGARRGKSDVQMASRSAIRTTSSGRGARRRGATRAARSVPDDARSRSARAQGKTERSGWGAPHARERSQVLVASSGTCRNLFRRLVVAKKLLPDRPAVGRDAPAAIHLRLRILRIRRERSSRGGGLPDRPRRRRVRSRINARLRARSPSFTVPTRLHVPFDPARRALLVSTSHQRRESRDRPALASNETQSVPAVHRRREKARCPSSASTSATPTTSSPWRAARASMSC